MYKKKKLKLWIGDFIIDKPTTYRKTQSKPKTPTHPKQPKTKTQTIKRQRPILGLRQGQDQL